MTDPSPFEERLLAELATQEEAPPASLALALDVDLKTVLDTAADLQARDLLARRGFQTCRLTDRGRALVAGQASH